MWRSLESVEFFDVDAVTDYALKLGKASTVAKVGFFLEQHREPLMLEEGHLARLERHAPSQPTYLERSKRESGTLVRRWNLVVPERDRCVGSAGRHSSAARSSQGRRPRTTGARLARMAGPARKPATYEDLLKLPEDKIGEIVDGDLYASPRPAGRHATCAFTLSAELGPPFQARRGGPGGWLFMFEPELRLQEDTLVPDLAGWRRERLPTVPDAASITIAPDWVCEILSPSTERVDRVRKLPAYARHDVGHAWLVNPTTRTLEGYCREGKSWVLVATHADDAVVRAEPFDAVELDLLRLWGEERPASPG